MHRGPRYNYYLFILNTYALILFINTFKDISMNIPSPSSILSAYVNSSMHRLYGVIVFAGR